MRLNYILILLSSIIVSSCVTKKQIHYLQDGYENNKHEINFQQVTIQPNDILKIDVETLVPEASLPYNTGGGDQVQQFNLQILQLQGYLVSNEGRIDFPIIGEIEVYNLTTNEVEEKLKNELVDRGHLVNPKIVVRIINSKVTILGEVNQPGTYTFTEQNITLLQALGYAGDLTINGKREDVIITRDIDGNKTIAHIDLTNTEYMNSEFFYVRPNDTIIVNQNGTRVKSAGFIGNVGALLGVTSILFSAIVLFSR